MTARTPQVGEVWTPKVETSLVDPRVIVAIVEHEGESFVVAAAEESIPKCFSIPGLLSTFDPPRRPEPEPKVWYRNVESHPNAALSGAFYTLADARYHFKAKCHIGTLRETTTYEWVD